MNSQFPGGILGELLSVTPLLSPPTWAIPVALATCPCALAIPPTGHERHRAATARNCLSFRPPSATLIRRPFRCIARCTPTPTACFRLFHSPRVGQSACTVDWLLPIPLLGLTSGPKPCGLIHLRRRVSVPLAIERFHLGRRHRALPDSPTI